MSYSFVKFDDLDERLGELGSTSGPGAFADQARYGLAVPLGPEVLYTVVPADLNPTDGTMIPELNNPLAMSADGKISMPRGLYSVLVYAVVSQPTGPGTYGVSLLMTPEEETSHLASVLKTWDSAFDPGYEHVDGLTASVDGTAGFLSAVWVAAVSRDVETTCQPWSAIEGELQQFSVQVLHLV